MSNKVSKEIREEALRITKSTQKRALSKEERKFIIQGIEKGITEYKKQQKAKSRERDKQRKAPIKERVNKVEVVESDNQSSSKLPWILLLLSWLGFALFLAL